MPLPSRSRRPACGWLRDGVDSNDRQAIHIIAGHDMADSSSDHTSEFLLAFDGRIHHLEEGYWVKFEIKTVEATKMRLHGLSYRLRCMRRMGRGWWAWTMPTACPRRARA